MKNNKEHEDNCIQEKLSCYKDYSKINHPSHYQSNNPLYETINVIEAWNLNFNLGNVIKYISRAGKKEKNSRIQDLEKARWYLSREIDKLKEDKREDK